MFPEHGTVSCVRLIMSVTTAGELMQDFAAAAHFKLSGETISDFDSKFLKGMNATLAFCLQSSRQIPL